MYCVGLTGGVASGKSTVAREFGELGVPTIDADDVARAVVRPGTPGLDQLVEAFGADILTPAGELDRASMRRRVFADPAERRRIEAILHPMIRARLRLWRDRGDAAYGLMVVPILIEGGFHTLVDRILVIDVPEPVQIARLVSRDGIDQELARQMLAAQLPRQQRLASADDTLDNSGPADALRQRVVELHRQYLSLAAAGRPQRAERETE